MGSGPLLCPDPTRSCFDRNGARSLAALSPWQGGSGAAVCTATGGTRGPERAPRRSPRSGTKTEGLRVSQQCPWRRWEPALRLNRRGSRSRGGTADRKQLPTVLVRFRPTEKGLGTPRGRNALGGRTDSQARATTAQDLHKCPPTDAWAEDKQVVGKPGHGVLLSHKEGTRSDTAPTPEEPCRHRAVKPARQKGPHGDCRCEPPAAGGSREGPRGQTAGGFGEGEGSVGSPLSGSSKFHSGDGHTPLRADSTPPQDGPGARGTSPQ